MRWAALLVGCSVILAAGPSLAEPAATAQLYALAWVRSAGAEDCPPTSELQRDVERRIERPLFEPAAALSIEASVQRDETVGLRSEIHVRDANGQTVGHRTLTSSETNCRSLFASTALAIALLVDPEGANVWEPSAAGQPTPPVSSAQSPNAQFAPIQEHTSGASAHSPLALVTPSQPNMQLDTPGPSSIEPKEHKSNRTAQMTASVLAAVSVVPDTKVGFAIGMRAWESRNLGWSLSAIYLPHGQSDVVDGSRVAVGLTALQPALAIELVGSDNLKLLADLGGSVGALQIAVRGTPAIGPTERWFLAARAEVGAQVRLSSSFFVELAMAGLVPLVRSRLIDNGHAELFLQPAAGGIGRIGIGMQFP
jgi:hypothetical protein